jgi:hypothetical protein
VDQREAQADGQPARAFGRPARGGAQDHDEEHRGEHHLGQQAVAIGGMFAIAIGGKAAASTALPQPPKVSPAAALAGSSGGKMARTSAKVAPIVNNAR